MNRQELINEVLRLGKELKATRELGHAQFNKLNEENLRFIIRLRNDRLEKRSVA